MKTSPKSLKDGTYVRLNCQVSGPLCCRLLPECRRTRYLETRFASRDLIVHALQKRDIIARAKTGTAKTVTGNTTLDVKAERAEDVLTHQRYMLRPRRKWELKVLI
ncbi:hypothetical protein YC2023_014813 [Brassica napus]